MKIAIILGTRPEIIKMESIIRECENMSLDYFILHTGQHYSYNMDKIFFEQLKLPEARYNLNMGSGNHGEQTGKMIIGIEKILMDERPDVVLVEGDTNTVLAGAIAACKLHIKIGHVEAGLRSYDRRMPEEINRILTDHCSDYLFAPTRQSKEILLKEGIEEEKIFVTGNTIVDAIYYHSNIENNLLDNIGLKDRKYIIATIHREENVDNIKRFKSILDGMNLVSQKLNIPIIYPIHPRSKKMIQEFGISINHNIRLIEPLDYLNFVQLERHSILAMTDSGGVQEETCILGVPCVTLRDNTERPETIEVGANILAGIEQKRILDCAVYMIERRNSWKNPFGDGLAGKNIVDILLGKVHN